MRMNLQHSLKLKTRWRHAIVLFALLGVISLPVNLGLSQVKSQKRVTALQLGEAAEGARVTIVSDSPLNDYEAFRRGDRFYVKIPLADFAAAKPNLRGNGFDDVQVQKAGDSVIVSFKLQPGATARVDQRSNRLDVIFSSVGIARSVPSVNALKTYPSSRNRRNTTDAEATAGPVPPTSSSSSGPSRSSEYAGTSSENTSNSVRAALRADGSSRRSLAQTRDSQNSRGNLAAKNTHSQSTPLPAGASSPAAMVSPLSTPVPPAAYATPSTANSQYPAGVSAPAKSNTAGVSSWDSRIQFLKAWATLNRSALIVGGVIALALLAGAVLWSRLKGRGPATAKTLRKVSGKRVTEKVAGRIVVETMPPANPLAAKPSPSAPQPRSEAWVPQPAGAGFGTAGTHPQRDADQDREVFEL
jgi:hypothetical protein